MEAKKAKVNREFKDGMFRTLFNDKEKMLELYNAVSEKQVGEEAIEDIDNGVATICESRLMGLLSGRWFESKSCIKLNILINVHVAQLDRAHAS